MPQHRNDVPIEQVPQIELTRRRFVAFPVALAAAAALRAAAERVAAADATPLPVDGDRLAQLTDLSRTLCGGGNLDAKRAANLLQLLDADADLTAGLDELLANSPVEGESLGSAKAQTTAQAILLFWYVDVFDGDLLPDRSSAYYQLTAWQAMYTPVWAVCKSFGGWGDAPRTEPLVPANS